MHLCSKNLSVYLLKLFPAEETILVCVKHPKSCFHLRKHSNEDLRREHDDNYVSISASPQHDNIRILKEDGLCKIYQFCINELMLKAIFGVQLFPPFENNLESTL